MRLYDFNGYKNSFKHGSYLGNAGYKDGIIVNGENWIIKYPKSTKGMSVDEKELPYTTAPLSEYIGSHVYELLGYDVHETLLGLRDGKIVVGCKDFCGPGEILAEIRGIKNVAAAELSKKLDLILEEHSTSGDKVNLHELFVHLGENEILTKVPGAMQRFWDMAVVDILINNNDRNNGNWGVLKSENGNMRLAPVYDNGNSFSNKTPDSVLYTALQNPEDFRRRETGTATIYVVDEHILSAKKLLSINDSELFFALARNIALIEDRLPYIKDMIMSIPGECDGLLVCSNTRKEYYCKSLDVRFEELIIPAYEKAMEHHSLEERLKAQKGAVEYLDRVRGEKRNKSRENHL